MEHKEKLVAETRIAEYSPTADALAEEAVQAALQWFENTGIVEMAEQMRAALDNAKKESMA